MRNFEVVLVCLIIGCLVQLIEPQEASNWEKDAVQEDIPPVAKLSTLENSDFDSENDDVKSRDKLNFESSLFSSRVRREESETDECGINSGTPGSSVWPWMAAIILNKKTKSDEIYCAGTIINKRFVLTAAACTTNSKGIANKPDTLSVVIGLANRSGADHSQQLDIRAVHVHPMYKYDTYDNAIALLELEKPIEYNNWISPICLPTTNNKFSKPESRGLGLGWGAGMWEPPSTLKRNTLKEVEVVIQHRDACIKYLGDSNARLYTDRLICGVEEGPYLCAGDSGAPLMQSEIKEDGHSVWTQVGIVNFGIGCGPATPMGFYTRIDKYIPWIQSTAF